MARARAGMGLAGRAGEVLMSVEDLFGSDDEDDAEGGDGGKGGLGAGAAARASGDSDSDADGDGGKSSGRGGRGSHRSEHANVRAEGARLHWPPRASDYTRDASELLLDDNEGARTHERPRTHSRRLSRAGQAPDARAYYEHALEEHLKHAHMHAREALASWGDAAQRSTHEISSRLAQSARAHWHTDAGALPDSTASQTPMSTLAVPISPTSC